MKRGRSAAARLAVSDELGLLKVVEVPSGPSWASSQVVQTWGQPDKSAAIHALAAPNYLQTDANVLAVSRLGGSIQLMDTLAGQPLCTLPPHKSPLDLTASSISQRQSAAREREVKCLAFRHEPASSIGGSSPPLELVSSTVGGTVRLHRQQQQDQENLVGELGESAQGSGSVQTWDEVTAFQASPNIGCMALDPSQANIAVGGDGCHLRVWSLDSKQEFFRAKAGKPSRCGLVDLPNLTAATYLADPSNQLVVVGTVKHKLWMYDLRAGKRPQIDMEWGDARVTALVADPDGQRVWAANGSGRIEGVDMRARAMRGCLKGPAGSIRALALQRQHSAPLASSSLSDGPPLMASAGLDRFLRVHSTFAGQQALGKVYLKQQLTGVAWLRPPAEAAGVGDEEQLAEEHEQDGQADQQQAIRDRQQLDGRAEIKAKELQKKGEKQKKKADKEGKGKRQRH